MIFDQFDMSVRMASILQEEALRLLPRMRARESEAVLRGDSASASVITNAIYWIEQAVGGPARSPIPSGPHSEEKAASGHATITCRDAILLKLKERKSLAIVDMDFDLAATLRDAIRLIAGEERIAREPSAMKPDAKPGLKECMAAINRARHRGLDWEFCARSPKVGLQLNIEEIEALGAYYVARERDGATGEGDCK